MTHDEIPDDQFEEDDEPRDPDIEDLYPDDQKKRMKERFLANYTDPVENTPYESAEGGYIFIWGGPYDPRAGRI